MFPPVERRGLPDGVAEAVQGGGRRFLYRPGELVVSQRDLETDPDLARQLDDLGARPVDSDRGGCDDDLRFGPAVNRRPARSSGGGKTAEANAARRQAREREREADRVAASCRLGYVLYRLPAGGPTVPAVVEQLRAPREGGGSGGGPAVGRRRVTPNIVLTGEQFPAFGPATDATRVDPAKHKPRSCPGGAGVRVAVVDTGLRCDHEWHSGRAVSRGAVDDEELDENDDRFLDPEAGHGTFCAGCVRELAPDSTIVGRAALDAMGVTDDGWVASVLYSLRGECVDIVNLSLGGYAIDGDPDGLPQTKAALDVLRHENARLVVVAAAGNCHSPEPFYPAALPDVIGVGALDGTGRRAWFSNYGPWVDTWAVGVDVVSSYVGPDLDQPNGGGPGKDLAMWSGTSFATPRVAGALAAAMARR